MLKDHTILKHHSDFDDIRGIYLWLPDEPSPAALKIKYILKKALSEARNTPKKQNSRLGQLSLVLCTEVYCLNKKNNLGSLSIK